MSSFISVCFSETTFCWTKCKLVTKTKIDCKVCWCVIIYIIDHVIINCLDICKRYIVKLARLLKLDREKIWDFALRLLRFNRLAWYSKWKTRTYQRPICWADHKIAMSCVKKLNRFVLWLKIISTSEITNCWTIISFVYKFWVYYQCLCTVVVYIVDVIVRDWTWIFKFHFVKLAWILEFYYQSVLWYVLILFWRKRLTRYL